MEGFNGQRKLTINLSVLFTNLADSFSLPSSVSSLNGSSNYGKSRIFQNTSVVGLSIVAAMMTTNAETDLSSSRPTPIVSSPSSSSSSSAGKKPPGVVMNSKMEPNLDHHHHREAFVDELSESYTCVISHFNGDHNSVQKRVIFDYADAEDVFHGDDDKTTTTKTTDHGVFFASSSPMNVGSEIKTQFWSRDFLISCFLCTKKLHGLDIFMYRGEKAFCSAECRDKHIRSDDIKETCGSEARKQLDYSVSPCSGPQPIFTGVAAA